MYIYHVCVCVCFPTLFLYYVTVLNNTYLTQITLNITKRLVLVYHAHGTMACCMTLDRREK